MLHIGVVLEAAFFPLLSYSVTQRQKQNSPMLLLLGHLTEKIYYLFRDLRPAPVLSLYCCKVAWFLSKKCIVRLVDLIPDFTQHYCPSFFIFIVFISRISSFNIYGVKS